MKPKPNIGISHLGIIDILNLKVDLKHLQNYYLNRKNLGNSDKLTENNWQGISLITYKDYNLGETNQDIQQNILDINYLSNVVKNKKQSECVPSNFAKNHSTLVANFMTILTKIEKLFKTKILCARILKVIANSNIDTHRDPSYFDFNTGTVARIHIPIQTSPNVSFYINNQKFHLDEGNMYYTNIYKLHKVENNGLEDRIHLVIDVELNDFLKDKIKENNMLVC